MDDQKIIAVGIKDLCEMLDLTRSRIGQLVKMGVIPKPVSRGCYDVEASVQGYINFLTADGPLKGVKRQQSEEYRFYRTKLMKNQADIAEIKLHRLSQSLIPADEARQTWAILVDHWTKRAEEMLDCSEAAFNAGSIREVNAILTSEIHAMLNDFANTEIRSTSSERVAD